MDCRPFFFKRFGMFHHRSTMRIGTDAVLFAQWVDVKPSDCALDIGTGSGVIPLILSQKGIGSVDAVELDKDSYEEAKQNFEISVWNEKLKVINTDVRIFADNVNENYDLIVSNPPFYRLPLPTSKVILFDSSRSALHLSFNPIRYGEVKRLRVSQRQVAVPDHFAFMGLINVIIFSMSGSSGVRSGSTSHLTKSHLRVFLLRMTSILRSS